MTPPRRGGAARVAVALVVAGAFGLGFLPSVGRAQQPGIGALTWESLPEGGSLAGHILLRLPDGHMMALGGESSPGVVGPQSRVLDLSRPERGWVDWIESGDVPQSRLPERGLLGAAAVVDAAENLVLLTCDCADGRNTFILNLATGAWQAASAPESPGALWYPILAYDAGRDRAVLIGGDRAGTGDLSGEVWSFDLSAARAGWTRLGDAGWSTPLLFSAYATGVDGALYVFSGGDALGLVQEQLWRVDLSRAGEAAGWSMAPTAGGPSGRLGASLVIDPMDGTGWLYGGYRAVADIPQDQGDVWRLTPAGGLGPVIWDQVTKLIGTSRPQARSGHAAAWDHAGKRMVVYGGAQSTEGQTSYLGDAWSLNAASVPDTATPPPPRPTEPAGSRIFLPWGFNP